MANLFDRILRAGEGRERRQLAALATKIDDVEEAFTELSDDDLRAETESFTQRLADGETLDDVLVEAFAVVREAAKRTLGQRHYTVQMQGAIALHRGRIAEMKTGEGKTLVITAAAYLNALSGKGVHVVTVNDYLATYQADLMGRVYRFLGLTTGVITAGLTPDQRREAYAADITYGTNNEFGFDYLRDNMAHKVEDRVQRGHNFVVVDEVDSILIDEARTPLIISGPADGDQNKWYREFARIVKPLRQDVDYEVDEKKRTVGVMEPGIDKVEDQLGIENLYESLNTPLVGFLNNAIKAKELFRRDKDYVVMNGEVNIVDEHTGRVLAGRRYSEGMHQAIEAKENVEIKAENQTLATITLQNYFKLYGKIAGLTGTAETEAAEFMNTYELGVVPIPTNRPMIRGDQADEVYRTEKAKFDAVVEDIVGRHEKGQPVLVGTTSVEKSEYLSKMLKKRGVPHEVLNAKQHEREARTVAMAGTEGAVTVATNMAGRGTDIMLGGNVEFMAHRMLEERGLDAEADPEGYEEAWDTAVAEAREAVKDGHETVKEAGGLYVLGTERHESRRIDNQLRGRSGRQGDPGESRFYLSLQDDLMRLFASNSAEQLLARGGVDESVPLTGKMVTGAIQRAQTSLESRNAEIRKNVLKYDNVMTSQRNTVYAERTRVLEGEDLGRQARFMIDDVVGAIVESATSRSKDSADWDLDELWSTLKPIYPVRITIDEAVEQLGGDRKKLSGQKLRELLVEDAHQAYDEREDELGERALRQLERRVMLSVMDRKWREHLYEMDYLKEGIGLRAMAQRDPLIEYEREGFHMFMSMREAIKEEMIRYLFNIEVQVKQQPASMVPQRVTDLLTSANKVADDARRKETAGAAAPAGATAAAAGTSGSAPAGGGADGEVEFEGLDDRGVDTSSLSYSAPSETGEEQRSGAATARTRGPQDGSEDAGMSRKDRKAAERDARRAAYQERNTTGS